MPENNLTSLTPTQAAALGAQIIAATGGTAPNPYSIPAATLNALSGLDQDTLNAATDVDAKKAALRASMQERDALLRSLVESLAEIARSVYANPAVTPAMVAALGLQPRSTARVRIVPKTPTDLLATVTENGAIALKWNRFGNAKGVNFVVEAKVGTGDWAFVGSTTACRLALEGYATGAAVGFRVSASNGGTVSAPSAAATVFPSSSSAPTLRLAA